MKIMKFGLKWVHMARYELILKLDGALWLLIISGPALIPKLIIQIQKCKQLRQCDSNLLFGILFLFVWVIFLVRRVQK